MKESDIQRDCEAFLKLHDFFYWRNHTSGVRFQGKGTAKSRNKGSPDLMAIKDGKFYAIEVKTPKGTLKEDQRLWLDKAKAYGAEAMVVRSVPELAEALGFELFGAFEPVPFKFD